MKRKVLNTAIIIIGIILFILVCKGIYGPTYNESRPTVNDLPGQASDTIKPGMDSTWLKYERDIQ